MKYPNEICSNNNTVLNSIMSGLSTGKMLKAGSGQVRQYDACKNKPN
mgnify:CR=1 FL=1